MTYFGIVAISIVLCSLLTKYFITFLTKVGAVDVPDDRRVHTRVTPRGGGIAIFLTFCILFMLCEYLVYGSLIYTICLIPALSIAAIISFIDDIKHVSILTRLIIHIISAATLLYWFLLPHSLFHDKLPLSMDYTLSVIALVGFLNIYNFLDGIDGITSAESIHISITLLLLSFLRGDIIIFSEVIALISLIILGVSIGFIRYNWYPAKIFLGDVGSITLGLLTGLSLTLVAASSKTLFVSACITALYYIADGGLTILIRLVNREKIWLPHLRHFFQQAIKKGMSHQEVTTKIILCNACLMFLAITALYYPTMSSICAVLIVTTTLVHFSK